MTAIVAAVDITTTIVTIIRIEIEIIIEIEMIIAIEATRIVTGDETALDLGRPVPEKSEIVVGSLIGGDKRKNEKLEWLDCVWKIKKRNDDWLLWTREPALATDIRNRKIKLYELTKKNWKVWMKKIK